MEMVIEEMQKNNKNSWSPDSWRKFPILQQPKYNDSNALKSVESSLSAFPSLIYPQEADDLKKQLAEVANGRAFLLQGGDCAESFAEFNEQNLQKYLRTLLQMTVILMFGARKPVVKVGRIAGQFSKPRSDEFEEKNGKKLPSYRGDMVNSMDFCEIGRISDPKRLTQVYFQSCSTLNYLRALSRGGFGALDTLQQWNHDFLANMNLTERFALTADGITNSLSFLKSCWINPVEVPNFHDAMFFVSHEALLLNYEEMFTRKCFETNKFYDGSAHMLWIGERTRGIDGAHVEFMRGIANPIGCKLGPTIDEDDLIRLIDVLNPNNEPGKLTLIARMGHDKIEKYLPNLVKRVKAEGRTVVWSCDPMHGNTIKSKTGYKTRVLENIFSEIKSFFAIHKSLGTYAGGIHIEMTGQDVTECLGGSQNISELNLAARYHTHCDPRLNASQSVELAYLIAEELTA